MSWDAGAITGDVTLDTAPLKASISDARAQVVGFRASTDKTLDLRFGGDLQARGRTIFESMRTPVERYKQTQHELNVLLHAGAISEETYARAVAKGASEFRSAGEAKKQRIDYTAFLRGGAALGVLTLAGQKFEVLTKRTIDVLGRLRDGTISASTATYDLGMSFLEALPGAGGLVRALDAIGKELDGTSAAARRGKLDLEDYLQQMEEGSKRHQVVAGYIAEIDAAAESAQRSMMALGRSYQLQMEKSPGDKIRMQADFDLAEAMAQIKELEDLRASLQSDKSFATSDLGKSYIDYLGQEIGKYQTVVGNFRGWMDVFADEADFKPIADLQKQVRQFDMTDLQKQFDDLSKSIQGKPTLLEKARVELEHIRGLGVGKIFDDLQSQLAHLDMTPLEAAFDQFRRANRDLNTDELAKAKKLMEEIDVKSKVKDALESIRSPLEKYQETLAQLEGWLSGGRINQQQFDQLNARARKDAFGETKLPGLIRAGSAEAQALRYDQERAAFGRSGRGQEALPQQQVAQQKITNQKLDLIARYIQQQLAGNGRIEFVGM